MLILLCLLTIGFLVPFSFPYFSNKKVIDFSEFEAEIASFKESQKEKPKTTYPQKEKVTNTLPAELFHFDPNTADKNTLAQLGLSEKNINTIINYRTKGGRFFKAADLQKIYGLSEANYLQLKDFVRIEQSNRAPKYSSQSSEKNNLKPVSDLVPEYFPFDPNTVSREDLIRLGLSERVTNTMLNFRNKGGTFYKATDLKKVYGVSERVYAKLEPYIQLAQKDQQPKAIQAAQKTQKPTYQKKVQQPIDINTASPEDWQSLKGIGPYYAKKIVEHRTKLGGFVNIEQITETYNFPDSTFQNIKAYLKVSPVSKTLAINKISEKGLGNHPYLSYKQAKVIINYRNKHGRFTSFEDFKKVKILKEKELNQLEPYLNFD